MNCCDYGCNQSANCPARIRSEFDANKALCKIETPPQYMPTVESHEFTFAGFLSDLVWAGKFMGLAAIGFFALFAALHLVSIF